MERSAKNLLLLANCRIVVSSFAAAYGVGLIALLAMPYLISAVMIDLQLSASDAGLLMSAEFFATMIASLMVAAVVGRIRRRRMAFVGACIALGANLLSAQVDVVSLLVVSRCIAGVGAGICLACGNALLATASDPERAAGYANVLFVALMASVMILFARVGTDYGLPGLYLAIGGIDALMLLLISWTPPSVPARTAALIGGSKKRNPLTSIPAICMMLGMFLFSMRDTMGWAFVEQVGQRVGYSSETIGNLLAIQSLLGLVGPVLASVIGRRYGLTLPVLIGVLSTGAVVLGYVLGEHSKFIYTVSVMLISATYFYALAYLTGLAATLDADGRIAAASGSFLTLGIAVGPTLTGHLAEQGGFTLVGWGIVFAVLTTLAALFVPLRVARNRSLLQRQQAAQAYP